MTRILQRVREWWCGLNSHCAAFTWHEQSGNLLRGTVTDRCRHLYPYSIELTVETCCYCGAKRKEPR